MPAGKKIKISDDSVSPFVLYHVLKIHAHLAGLQSMLTTDQRKKVSSIARRHFDDRLASIETTNPGLAAKIRAWSVKSGGDDVPLKFRAVRRFRLDD